MNNIVKILILKTLLLWSFFCFGQLESNNWYFGNTAGVTFNSGTPTALTNGILVTTEGVATISSNTGNLLFYTDGVTVYNRVHVVMTNGTGLFGDASSTQSAIIVQKPGSASIYYIFTSDNDAGPNGICYSTVDMGLTGGLGAVTVKNTPLYTPSCEKLCAVRHCNNTDLWIISHDWNANTFRCWLVSPTGVSSTQTSSASGVVVSGASQGSFGQLKASSDGRRLAACYYGLAGGINKIEIYDFNPATGLVSNAQTISTELGIYGCEFSPNGRVLYGGCNQGLLLQWNLCAGTLAQIRASRTVITNAGPFIGSLQIGPDSKIYVARASTSLSVINSPNTLGVACGYSDLSIPLLGRSSRMGLPNFASYYFINTPSFTSQINSCNNVTFTGPILLNCLGQNEINSYSWNFGDGDTGTGQTITHIYNASGIYTVALQVSVNCSTRIITTNINVSSATSFNISLTLQ